MAYSTGTVSALASIATGSQRKAAGGRRQQVELLGLLGLRIQQQRDKPPSHWDPTSSCANSAGIVVGRTSTAGVRKNRYSPVAVRVPILSALVRPK